MPGIGKSTIARKIAEDLAEKDLNVHWVQLDAYCDVHEAMQRMEVGAPQILDVEGYASSFELENVVLVFDDVHSISSRHQESFSNLFEALENHSIPFMLLGRDRDTFSIDGTYVELGPLEQTDAIELLNPELGDERETIVEALGGHPLAILLHDASTPLPETNLTFVLMLIRLFLAKHRQTSMMLCHRSWCYHSRFLQNECPSQSCCLAR